MKYRHLVLTRLVLLLVCCAHFLPSNGDEDETTAKGIECVEKCGGGKHLIETLTKTDLCVKDLFGYKFTTASPCILECIGKAPEEDQLKCLAEYCKIKENHKTFCELQNRNYPIRSPEKCDNLVPTGKAKFLIRCTHMPDRGDEKYNRHDSSRLYWQCAERCGGMKLYNSILAKGDAVCIFNAGNIATTCVADCLRAQPDEDQIHCMTRRCQTMGGFCRESGGVSISRDECHSIISKGEAKYYGNCKSRE